MVSMIAFLLWLFILMFGLVLINFGMWLKLAQWFGGEDRPNTFAFHSARLSVLLTFNSWLLGTHLYWEGRSVMMSNEMAPIHWMMSSGHGTAMLAASLLISLLSPFTVIAALSFGVIAILRGRGGKDPRSVWLGGIGVALNGLLLCAACGFCVFSVVHHPSKPANKENVDPKPYSYHGEQPKWNDAEDVAEFAAPYKARGYQQIVKANWRQRDPITEPTIVFASNATITDDVNVDLVIVAQSANIRGDVTGDMEFFGQSLRVDYQRIIDGNLHIHGAQSVRIYGEVTGNVSGNYNKLKSR